MMPISTAMLCKSGYRWFQFDLTMISINLQHKYGTSCHAYIYKHYSNVGCLILITTSCWKFNRQKTATSATLFWTCMHAWDVHLSDFAQIGEKCWSAYVHSKVQNNKQMWEQIFQNHFIPNCYHIDTYLGHLILINVWCPHVEMGVEFEHLPLSSTSHLNLVIWVQQ